jgi:cardiolipin synthase (CMP-forming)
MGKIKTFILKNNWLTPNLVTSIRLIGCAPLIFLLLQKHYTTAFFLFIFLGLTDLLDGFIARTKGLSSQIGVVFDTMTDKILFLPTLVILGFQFLNPEIIIVIVALEITPIPLFFLSKIVGFKAKLSANLPNKIKFSLECSAIVILLMSAGKLAFLSYLLLIMALCFGLVGLTFYFFKNLKRN